MTDTKLIRDFWAEPSPRRNGWIGRYQAPGVGVCTVKVEGAVLRESGKPVAKVFETKIEAEMAAARAKDFAEDRHRRPPSPAAQVFQAVGTGRNRRAIAI